MACLECMISMETAPGLSLLGRQALQSMLDLHYHQFAFVDLYVHHVFTSIDLWCRLKLLRHRRARSRLPIQQTTTYSSEARDQQQCIREHHEYARSNKTDRDKAIGTEAARLLTTRVRLKYMFPGTIILATC
jgi:hypothetical protein